ncbi:MAG: ATP-binding protein [Chitinophagaceae bacterium]|nr:ATP-binding protein [Chitinophagaceae bacterium]
MRLNLKSKIALGGIFLFSLLLAVGAVSFIYFNKLITESREIVKDNYESIDYARNMLTGLEKIFTDSAEGLKLFEQYLVLQKENITEAGEDKITAALSLYFDELKSPGGNKEQILSSIRADLNNIMLLNLQAIQRKNNATQESAEKAKMIITILVTVCLLIGFTFIFNFPGFIANPVSKLTEGIKEIAAKNYEKRIVLNRTDEFGEMAGAFNNMAERLDEYEHSNLAQILFEKQRAETVINSLKDASIGLDNKGKILFANRQALAILNLKEADVLGKSSAELEKKNDLFRYLVQAQNNTPFKIVLDNKENYFTREVIDIKPEDQPASSVIVIRNITPFKEIDVAKTNFIATISHELKTPLASADFSLKLLEDERIGKLTVEQKELIQSLKNDNQRLLRILSELLDLSQVESGRIQLNMQNVSPFVIFDAAINAVINTAREKNVTIKKEIEPALPPVYADQEKTTWVMNNFLTNAIRYSPENAEIIIRIKKAGDAAAEFSVQDFGTGIDPSFHQKIFDRFFRVPGTGKKGSGLGLAISREFIEAQGGTIGLESGPGKGSRFYFLLKTSSPL